MVKSNHLAALLTAFFLVGCSGFVEQQAEPSLSESMGPVDKSAATQSPYSAMKKNSVDSRAKNKFSLASKAIHNKDFLAAEAPLLWLTVNYPQYSGPFLNLAVVYTELKQPVKAESYFKKAIEVNKLNLRAYNSYGVYLRGEGRFEEAEVIYLNGLTIWDDDMATHKNLGILYELYMGKLPEALVQYRRYLELLMAVSEGVSNPKEIKRIKGWVVDLERRIKRSAAAGAV